MIEKIRQKSGLSAIIAVLLAIIILFLSQAFTHILTKGLNLDFFIGGSVMKAFMLVFSILFILLLNKGKLKGYGFRMPENINYLKMTIYSIIIMMGAMFICYFIFQVLLSDLFPSENAGQGFPDNNSFLELVLSVWLWSSICEEVLTSGFMQGFMNHHTNRKFIRLSLPVWVSGVFFGAMHIGLLGMGFDKWFVFHIVTTAIILGLLSGYYREKTKSILPAIIIHVLANILGYLSIYIF